MTLFLKDVCSLPTLETGARNLRNLFSKLLILQNNHPPPCEPCQIPCWTMMVLFTWKRKLAWAAAFINFPFLFSPTTCLSWHSEGPFWAQQVVLCAWHHLKLVQVSGGLFAALPLRMFADPKKQLCLTRFSCLWQAWFCLFFFLVEKHELNQCKFQNNTEFLKYDNLYNCGGCK